MASFQETSEERGKDVDGMKKRAHIEFQAMLRSDGSKRLKVER